ncbi:isocitrate lyase/phosphoenolpyruvate mutase family protein [Leucobacter sp. CSA1]|uniref:Isocitrate lyase/phosphoenolpyruvate mutase family protein n=1 Tax=Leucobacter chromiisoli TaxID=2796471 RepID=A0A934Q531_9MICO|nr:isocitrate lyase/phosphoenolpyruvate mutase family protein [Leucobacter chromiisoli]MBK0417508.1 isocitrate lyase/phosphoenolpyruvate mutase family protein [Leucobacter chromiisoli]
MNTTHRTPARAAVHAHTLSELYAAPEILRVVNVWDAVSARVVSELPGTRAIATAGHGIAASHGYPDGERIPLDLMLAALERIVDVSPHPVSADLDGGYDDAGETVRRAVGIGISGANIEDRLRPLDESVEVMTAAVRAAEAEGVRLALNARTDAFVLGGDRGVDANVADAIERGRAYLDAGATCVFVPGVLDAEVTGRLVEGIGERRVSVIGLPGALSAAEYEALGVARISYGPMPQNVALTALKRLAQDLQQDGVIPEGTEKLNDM